MTALMVAAKEGVFPIVNELLKKGAYINIADHKGETPLIHAAKGRLIHTRLPDDEYSFHTLISFYKHAPFSAEAEPA